MVADIRYRNQLVVTTTCAQQAKVPLITLACGNQDFAVDLTPEAAHRLASELSQAAEAAINESFLVSYLQTTLGLEPKDAIEALEQGRTYRERIYGSR